MGTTNSGSVRSSAGCRYGPGISLYGAHAGSTEGPLLYASLGVGPRLASGKEFFFFVFMVCLSCRDGDGDGGVLTVRSDTCGSMTACATPNG